MPSEEINRKNCGEKIELRKNIVAAKFKAISDSEPVDTPTRFYFSPTPSGNPRNAFLFEREDVLRIFFPKIVVEGLLAQLNGAEAPTHLLAILGAHNQKTTEFNKGESTVIVMGVKSKDGGPITNISSDAVNVPIGSMDIGNPKPLDREDEIVGFEYPPSDGLVIQPPAPIVPNANSPMEFKFSF